MQTGCQKRPTNQIKVRTIIITRDWSIIESECFDWLSFTYFRVASVYYNALMKRINK